MHLDVQLFGGLADRVGTRRVVVTVPDDATVADLRRALAAAYPALADALPATLVAVDLTVASDTAIIDENAEVALLPPVAGGAAVKLLTGLRSPPFDVDAVVAEVTSPPVGGVVTFLGTVRDHATDLGEVARLDYSAYEAMAEKVLADLATEIVDDHPEILGLALLHATGGLEVGDHTILVVACAAHRGPAFDACRDALERVKERLPVWKREVFADGGHRWVGLPPTPT